jgi:hypothetical protein
VSRGGLFVCCREPPPADSAVELALELPGAVGPLILQGRVVWVRRGSWPGAGIAFRAQTATAVRLVTELARRLEARVATE